MDAVRFGRALGFGARQAAKTVVRAVDAAQAENPSRPVSATIVPSTSTVGPASQAISRTSATQTASATTVIPPQSRGIQEGVNRFKASAVEPVVRLSGVLWLEVTGVFFALFALGAAGGVWRLRAELRPALAHPFAHGTVIGTASICMLFAYFSISSFVRAYRRQRRR